MTLQIGIVGTDGIVLASDTKILSVEQHPYTELPARSSSMGSKFVERDGFVCCWSGDDISRSVVDNICATKWDKGKGKNDVQNYLDDATRKEKVPADDKVRKAIVVDPEDSLWEISIRGTVDIQEAPENTSYARSVYCKVATGDNSNNARYWPNCHLADVQNPYLQTKELLLLAAHTILMGAKDNPTGVGGLEIRVIQKGVRPSRRLTEEEIKYLTRRSEELTQTIQTSLFTPIEI
jgi:hypothetical protein